METTVAVAGDHAAEDLRELRSSLLREPELRGRVHLTERPPDPEHLGTVPDLISVLLQSGTAATVLTSAVVTWLRHRTSDVDCTITRSDGSTFTLSAKRVQESGMEAEHELIREVSAALANGGVDGPEAAETENEDRDPESAP